MLAIKLAMLLLLAGSNWARGYHWRPLGIAVMSISMGLYFALTLKIWWLLFAIGCPMGICLGLHDQNRGVWSLFVALGASFALFITGHLTWYWFGAYLAYNYLIAWQLVKQKVPQVITDPVNGAAFGSLVFLC